MKVGGDVNINKYIELLRFYLTDRIGQIEATFKRTIGDEITEIISSVLSAIFSLFLSQELIKLNGFWGTVLRILSVIILYFIIKIIIKKIHLYFRVKKSIDDSDKRKLSNEDAKLLVDKFDHIACDGLLLSRDYLKKYMDKESQATINEKQFYLFEAFYYYKKSLDLSVTIVEYADCCLNSIDNINRISLYRFFNIYKSLEEIRLTIKECVEKEDIEQKEELTNEISRSEKKFEKISSYITAATKPTEDQ